MVSQLSYLFSVLECPDEILDRMQATIDKFVLKSATPWMAKDRLYLPVTKGGLGAINLRSFSTSLKMSWARRAATSTGIWATILRSKVSSNLNICYIRKTDLKPHNIALKPIVGSFEEVVSKKLTNLKSQKALLTMTPLSHIECIKIQRPRKKPIFVKPTKASHPELFPGNKICEIRPMDLLDRLNLELGIIKVIQPERMHRLLGTTDSHPLQKTMIVMRVRKIMEHLHDYVMVERRQSVFTISEIVDETKKGSKKYRNILDVRDNITMKPWTTANEKYGISTKEGNESYFHEMNQFTKNKY